MFRRLKSVADSYITNKIINNSYRAEDSATGGAATLDLFKLYSESTISGSTNPIELSRLLIKMDLDPLRALTGSVLDISHSSFNVKLVLKDVQGGQTYPPTPFKVILYPLSKSFDEGLECRDVVSYADIGVPNFLTASVANGSADLWVASGCNAGGKSGNPNIDYIYSHPVVGALHAEQTFTDASSDLELDITTIVSATIAGIISDHGFRISYSGSFETNQSTYFIKRFGSRHVNNGRISPKLLVKYNDAINDNTSDSFFDLSGTIFLANQPRGQLAHIISGNTSITGNNSLLLRLESGSQCIFKITGSQHKIGVNFVTGVYSASFAIPSNKKRALRVELQSAGSATFDAYWSSTDQSVPYLTSSLVIREINRSSFNNTPARVVLSMPNLRDEYSITEIPRLRVYAQKVNDNLKATKLPLEGKSEIYNKMYYRVRDAYTNDTIIPFDADGTGEKNATLLSTDTGGMYFDAYFISDLIIGRVYAIDLMVKTLGVTQVYDNLGVRFKIIS